MMRPIARILIVLAALLSLAPMWAQSETGKKPVPVHFHMQGIHFRFMPSVAVDIRSLDGELIAQHGSHPIFDDKDSFILQVESGEVSVSPEAMSDDLNDYVFHYPGAPLSDLKVTLEKDGTVKIAGKLHKGIPIPFSTKGPMSTSPDGKIVIQAKELHALGIPAKDLLGFFGADVADLVNTRNARGVRVEKDRFILDANMLFPPPHLQTKVRESRVAGGQIVLMLGSGAGKAENSKGRSGNYQVFKGGTLQFGKLTMHDTDLILIDEDPRDPFDFFLDHYAEQLAAGYSKTLIDQSLKTYMPDYDDMVKKKTSAPARKR